MKPQSRKQMGARPGARRPPQPLSPPVLPGASRFVPKQVVRESDRRLALRGRFALFGRMGAYAAGVVLVLGAFAAWDGYREGCKASKARRRALEAVTAQTEGMSGEPMSEHFDDGMFYCVETTQPAGVLVAMREDEEREVPVWFVDRRGVAQNVNLLSKAYTPRLPPAPHFTPAQLRRLTR